MRALTVVKSEVPFETLVERRDCLIVPKVDLCKSFLQHFKLDVLSSEGHNAKDSGILVVTILFDVYGLVEHQSSEMLCCLLTEWLSGFSLLVGDFRSINANKPDGHLA